MFTLLASVHLVGFVLFASIAVAEKCGAHELTPAGKIMASLWWPVWLLVLGAVLVSRWQTRREDKRRCARYADMEEAATERISQRQSWRDLSQDWRRQGQPGSFPPAEPEHDQPDWNELLGERIPYVGYRYDDY